MIYTIYNDNRQIYTDIYIYKYDNIMKNPLKDMRKSAIPQSSNKWNMFKRVSGNRIICHQTNLLGRQD